MYEPYAGIGDGQLRLFTSESVTLGPPGQNMRPNIGCGP